MNQQGLCESWGVPVYDFNPQARAWLGSHAWFDESRVPIVEGLVCAWPAPQTKREATRDDSGLNKAHSPRRKKTPQRFFARPTPVAGELGPGVTGSLHLARLQGLLG